MKGTNDRKTKSWNRLRVEKGPIKIREEQKAFECQSRKRKIKTDPVRLHMGEIKRKKLSRAKQKQEAPLKLKEDQNRWQQKHRLVDSQKKRLYRFKRNTMFNAIFTCMCCQRNLFECNVTKLTSSLLAEIERKKPGLYVRAIEEFNSSPIMVNINGSMESYICLACRKHICRQARFHPCLQEMNSRFMIMI